MEQCFDYKGNEIKEGMIIHFVTTNEHTMAMGMLIPSEGYARLSEATDTPCWKVSPEYVVLKDERGLYINITDGNITLHQPCHLLNLFENPTVVIQGISDKNPNE